MKKLLLFCLFLAAVACQNSPKAGNGLETIAPTAFAEKLASKEMVLLDVRTEEEFKEGHLEGAIQHDYYETESFQRFLAGLDTTKSYLIYCRSGGRSGTVLDMMAQMGFDQVYNLDGGINAWKSAGLPVVR